MRFLFKAYLVLVVIKKYKMKAGWMFPHGTVRGYTPLEQKAVHIVMQHLADKHEDDLWKPDAWFCKTSGKVVSDKTLNAVPLVVGDVVQYECARAFMHEMIYVGAGYVATLTFKHLFKWANVTLMHLDDLKPWLRDRMETNPYRVPAIPRKDVAARAMMSIGTYPASLLQINCQLFTQRVLGYGPRPPKVGDHTVLVAACVVIYALLSVLTILGIATVCFT